MGYVGRWLSPHRVAHLNLVRVQPAGEAAEEPSLTDAALPLEALLDVTQDARPHLW